jgi:hypothetical protein
MDSRSILYTYVVRGVALKFAVNRVNLDLVGAVNMVLRNNATASQQQENEGNEDALTA